MSASETCLSDYDPDSVSVEEALQRIDGVLQPVRGVERIALRSALGRVLAKDIITSIPVPPHDNAMMDGYAVRGSDLSASEEVILHNIGVSYAGHPFSGAVTTGQCVRIFTGGVMPSGADTVIMQEHVSTQDAQIIIPAGEQPGQFVYYAGDDIRQGQAVLSAGRRLRPADLGVLASVGTVEVCVTRRVRVGFMATGDELQQVGKTLQPGQIYDSNRYTLYGMLQRVGVEVLDMGVLRDSAEKTASAFLEAAAQCDVLITSGGVSVGEADFVTRALHQVGNLHFWKIAVKPGRPFTFGHLGNTAFFGLPGNPVAVSATFYAFVQPALRRLMGEQHSRPLRFQVPCISPLKKRPGRLEYQRGILGYDGNGQLVVNSTGKQISGILSSMSQANCFIVLPVECSNVPAGTVVMVEPFEGLV